MNRKLLNYILSGALLFSCVGFLSSCKDTCEDQWAEIESQIVATDNALKDQLKAANQNVENLKNELATVKENLQAQIDALKNAGSDPAVLAEIAKLQAQIDALKNAGSDPALEARIKALEEKIAQLKSCGCDPTLPAQLQALSDRLAAVEALLDAINIEENKQAYEDLFSTTLPELTDKVLELEKNIEKAGITLEEVFADPRLADALKLIDTKNLEEILKSYNVSTLPEALRNLIRDVTELKALEIPADLTAEVTALTGDVNGIKDQISAIQTNLGLKADQSALEDLANKLAELAQKHNTLEENVNGLTGKVDGLEDNLEALTNTVEAYKAELVKEINKVNDALNARVDELDTKVDTLIEKLKAEFKAEIDRLEGKVDQNKQDIDQNKQDIDQNKQDIDQNKQDIDQNKQDIDQNKQDIADNKDAIDQNTTDIEANKKEIEALKNSVKALQEKLDEIVSCNCADEIKAIKDRLDDLEAFQEATETLTEDLTNRINKLENGLNSIVSSIINSIVIQQVTNKVFGSLSLPLGIQTNILMAYQGYNASGIQEFPSDYTQYEYNGGDTFNYKAGELNGVKTMPIGNLLLDESPNNAGNVYFTVNPSNVNLTNSVFTLVNSLDQSSGILLSTPQACDKLLYFGWSRAENGFYVSNASLTAENLSKCTLNLGDGLKHEIETTAKDFLKDLRDQERPDISQIATTIKNVLQHFNGQLAANAIRGEYQYTDLSGKTVKAATYSNYAIAAASFEPQSFCFLANQQDVFNKLPEVPTIDNFEFDMGEVKIDFNTNFKVNGLDVKINFDKIDINKEDFTLTTEIWVDTYDPETQQVVSKPYEVSVTATRIMDLVKELQDKLEGIVGQVNKEINDQVNDMVAQINKQVTDMLESMEADVNSQLNNLLQDLSSDVSGQLDKYIDRINKLIGKINGLIARVNKVLANPNKYLQPLVIYTAGNGDMHVLSTSRVAPTRFYLNGGDATTLYFTSYTLEAIAPSYKKFAKVVKAWKNGDASKANVSSVVSAVNAKGSLNQIINGDQIRFAFAPEAGYTYEIVFQALDYQGYTSTRRCFIEVR